jgi:hypothetical protein
VQHCRARNKFVGGSARDQSLPSTVFLQLRRYLMLRISVSYLPSSANRPRQRLMIRTSFICQHLKVGSIFRWEKRDFLLSRGFSPSSHGGNRTCALVEINYNIRGTSHCWPEYCPVWLSSAQICQFTWQLSNYEGFHQQKTGSWCIFFEEEKFAQCWRKHVVKP